MTSYSDPEPTMLEIAEQGARALALGGEVGHIPTVVGLLLDEYDRRAQVIEEQAAKLAELTKSEHQS